MPRSVIVLHQAFWSIGTVFEVLLALWIMPLLGWRWLLGLSTIPVAIFIICCYVSVFFALGLIWTILLFRRRVVLFFVPFTQSGFLKVLASTC